MAARRPRAALDAGPHRHARTRRRQRGGRGHSYAYRATTCPRPGSDAPPARAAPARPAPAAQASNTARLRRAAARALPPTAPIASPTPASRAHRPTAVCDTPRLPSRRGRRPAIRNQLHRPQAHLISDPHPTRHINHSSEPVMVQPSPDTATAPLESRMHISRAKCTSRRAQDRSAPPPRTAPARATPTHGPRLPVRKAQWDGVSHVVTRPVHLDHKWSSGRAPPRARRRPRDDPHHRPLNSLPDLRGPRPACVMRAQRNGIHPASRRAGSARHDPPALDPREPTWRNAT